MHFNFRKDVIINTSNILTENPVIPGDVQREKVNGKYIYEIFYLIDFLDIKENSYVISSFGRVFSLIVNRELVSTAEKFRDNYKTIQLMDNTGNKRKFPVHCLVARAFIPKTESDIKMNRIYIHHKNWDNGYNYYWNLEWRSPVEIMVMTRIKNTENIEEYELVTIVCKLLENGEPTEDIFDIICEKMSKHKIWMIKKGLIYRSISQDYNI